MSTRLLLIDDDPALRTALSDMLSFHFPELDITAVDSGAAAITHIAKDDYDLVLCDMIMPGMDGIATINAIREMHPRLRVFLMTGHPHPETVFSSAGATGFIKKPLDRDRFLDLMRRTLAVILLGKRAAKAWERANLILNSRKSDGNRA
jgi:DNA-binding NtrC family response regulator